MPEDQTPNPYAPPKAPLRIEKPTQGFPTPRAKWLLVLASSLVISPWALKSWPPNFAGIVGTWIGTAVVPFGLAMLFAIFFKGWPGVIVGVVIVIAVTVMIKIGQ